MSTVGDPSHYVPGACGECRGPIDNDALYLCTSCIARHELEATLASIDAGEYWNTIGSVWDHL